MSLNIHCPFCGQHYSIDDYKEEVELQCSICGQTFLLNNTLLDNNSSNLNNELKQIIPAYNHLPPKSSSSFNKMIKGSSNEKHIHHSILERIYDICTYLSFASAVLFLIVWIGDSNGSAGLMCLFSLISAFVCWGLSELFHDITENSFHITKQTELLEKILIALTHHKD